MWYLYSRGGVRKLFSKSLYLKMLHRYGCLIFPNIDVGKGFSIAHPVGIVIGRCQIGNNFTIYQNASIGVKHPGDESKRLIPRIGDNVRLYAGSAILGNVSVTDNTIIGANSLVIHDVKESGVYVGNPVRKIAGNN